MDRQLDRSINKLINQTVHIEYSNVCCFDVAKFFVRYDTADFLNFYCIN